MLAPSHRDSHGFALSIRPLLFCSSSQGSQPRISLIGGKDRMGHDGANTLLSYTHVQVDPRTALLSMIA
jgi:hypothetical protein